MTTFSTNVLLFRIIKVFIDIKEQFIIMRYKLDTDEGFILHVQIADKQNM